MRRIERNEPAIVEQPDAVTIYCDGSVVRADGQMVRILLFQKRATKPTEADHVATIVAPMETFVQENIRDSIDLALFACKAN